MPDEVPRRPVHQARRARRPAPLPTATYVVANGVLTYKADLAHHEMWEYAQRFLERAYSMARRGLAFNVMTTHLDWERDDLFHVPFDTMAAFVHETLSRNFVFRQDYGAYEYTVYVYRDPAPSPGAQGGPLTGPPGTV